jgi:hypothetical protein
MFKLLKFGLIGLSTTMIILVLLVPSHTMSTGQQWLLAGLFFSIIVLIVIDLLLERYHELKEDREYFEKRQNK